MASQQEGDHALDTIMPRLQRTEHDPRPIAVMIGGMAGSGKSTLAKAVVNRLPNFTRLSVDKILYETRGLYKINYPPEKHEEYLDEAQGRVKSELGRVLREEKHDVALDLSFWNKQYRDEYKTIIEENGGRWVLVFLDADKELLWRRVTSRRAKRDALSVADEGRDGDSSFDIDEKTFGMWFSGFERPKGEGEVVIQVV